MPKTSCDSRQAREHSLSLDERIAQLRRRRTVLTQLMDSLTAYTRCDGQESGLANVCHLHNPSRRLPDKCAPGSPGQRDTLGDGLYPS
jgi:hypothetical protein